MVFTRLTTHTLSRLTLTPMYITLAKHKLAEHNPHTARVVVAFSGIDGTERQRLHAAVEKLGARISDMYVLCCCYVSVYWLNGLVCTTR